MYSAEDGEDGYESSRPCFYCMMVRFCLIVFCFFFVSFSYAVETSSLHKVCGKVVSGRDPIPFAYLFIEELNRSFACDVNGEFCMEKMPPGTYTLRASSMEYADVEMKIDVAQAVADLIVRMKVSSTELPEFEVMANRKMSDKITVGEEAIQYTQPTSLADVLLLLPGNVYQENNMSGFIQLSNRQVGSDANSSLGMAVLTDGSPMSNDGTRVQMVGITGGSSSKSEDSEFKSRFGLNQGTDMRYISTDHIHSVEFTQGISSARYGNLSSGMIHINSKHGVSPLNVRAKTDLKNKLFYVGKGFKLSDRLGTLHLGVDYLHSVKDIREEMDKFSRVTGQAYYNNSVKLGSCKLHLDAKFSQTVTANKMKKDELTYEYDETYLANYAKSALMVKGKLDIHRKWIDLVELTASGDITSDRVDRHKMVLSSSGPLSVPLATEVGEHEGQYLPGKYYSDFQIENIPLHFYTQLHAESRFHFSKMFRMSFLYGVDFNSTKNYGQGVVLADPTRPPFPYDNTYMRPRANCDIPALETGGAYLQDDMTLNVTETTYFTLSLGGRLTKMFNLDDSYELAHRVLAEPRTNFSFKFGKKMKNTLRFGYGEENKLPTLDYLYPEKLYKDFYMLNAFTNEAANRHLITYTNIFEVENKKLTENKNRKIEWGWSGELKDCSLNLTCFYERSNSGFDYFLIYSPLEYTLYSQLKPNVNIAGRMPQKEDYVAEPYSVFTTSSYVMNSKKTIKKGIEYRLILPTIKALRTSVEVNGAYYKTRYGSNLPSYYYPGKRIADRPYPYVGIYDMDAQTEKCRLNTNIWFNTHIPRMKFAFTNFFQIIWLETEQYIDTHNKIPYQYLDMNGVVHDITDKEVELIRSDDAVFRHLKQTILPIEYEKDAKPIALLWNLKATKEFSKAVKLSFFVNGILDIHPKYVSGEKTTEREWTDPHFGLELYWSFGK